MGTLILSNIELLDNCSNTSRSYCTSTLTDSECKTLLHSYWMNQLDCHLYVITRHAHLCSCWKLANTCYVCCSEVELWTIVVEEWSMTSTFILC